MIKYIVTPNSNYNSFTVQQNLQITKIEKIVWYKKVGDYLHPGDILCEIHYNDSIFEIECSGGDYLLYKNTNTEVSFSCILSVFGDPKDDFKSVFKKHNKEIESLNYSFYKKLFSIESCYSNREKTLVD